MPGPASYVEVGRLDGRVRNDLDALASECAGTRYEAACAAVVDDVERSGMLDAVEVLFDGGSPDLTALLGPQHAGTWATFIEQVGATMSAGA